MATWTDDLSAAWTEVREAMRDEEAISARFQAVCAHASRSSRPEDAANADEHTQWTAARSKTDAAWANLHAVLDRRTTE